MLITELLPVRFEDSCAIIDRCRSAERNIRIHRFLDEIDFFALRRGGFGGCDTG